MKNKLLILAIGLIIGLFAGIAVGYGVGFFETSVAASNKPTTSELLALVNAERARNGVAPLKEDVRLDASAQMKANDEVGYGYYGHISPKGSPYAGMHGYKLIDMVGLSCIYESENLVNPAPDTASKAVQDWIASKPHHDAMIDAKYSLTGFGINGDMIVEHFCQTK